MIVEQPAQPVQDRGYPPNTAWLLSVGGRDKETVADAVAGASPRSRLGHQARTANAAGTGGPAPHCFGCIDDYDLLAGPREPAASR